MDNQHLIGQVMLDKINGNAVVIESVVYRDFGSVARVNNSFQNFNGKQKTIGYYIPVSQLTTNPALVVQSVG